MLNDIVIFNDKLFYNCLLILKVEFFYFYLFYFI